MMGLKPYPYGAKDGGPKRYVAMTQSQANQIAQMALAGSDAINKLEGLLVLSKRFPDEEWAKWFEVLAKEAGDLLDGIDRRKDIEREKGATKGQIDGLIRHIRETAKPSIDLRKSIQDKLGQYRIRSSIRFDAETCKLMQTDSHPASASTACLVAFSLATAIRDQHWQSLRQCKEPKCGKLFIDHISGRGRKPMRYCCTNHQQNHRKRLDRGTA